MANYDEQKVSITLSAIAYQTITDDKQIFLPDESWAGFINTIISGFKDDTIASIKRASLNERKRLIKYLHNEESEDDLSSSENDVINKIIAGYSVELREKMRSYSTDSGKTQKIRINNLNKDTLILSDESKYVFKGDYTSAGKFIKAILENYAEQPFSTRERIVFHNTIKIIKSCAANKNVLKFLYKGLDNKLSELEIRPYDIVVDGKTNYAYCVGILYDVNVKKTDLYSLRLYRIQGAPEEVKGMPRSAINKQEAANIEKKIRMLGVAYIQSDAKKIRVELSPKGQNLYNSILHMRPSHTNEDALKTGEYHFDCSEKQVENYFFRFGKDALILEPTELKNTLFTRYQEASEKYKTD